MKHLPHPSQTILWEYFPLFLKLKSGKSCELGYAIVTTDSLGQGMTVDLRFSIDSSRSHFALNLAENFERILNLEKEHGLPITIDTSLMYVGSLYVRTGEHFPNCSESMAESLRMTLIDLANSVIEEVTQTMEEFE